MKRCTTGLTWWVVWLSAAMSAWGQPYPGYPAGVTATESNATGSGHPASGTVLQPFYVRSRRFGLPVQLLQTPYQVQAVQLYVSRDGGATWQLYAQQPVPATEFTFEAPNDGSYWFSSKTVDVQNVVRPGGVPRPEQWVVVDTARPQIQLYAELQRDHSVRIAWQVVDENLDVRSLRLEFREGILSAWQPLIDPVPLSQSPPVAAGSRPAGVHGQYVWRPEVQAKVIELRMTAADLAGNTSLEIQRVFLPKNQTVQPQATVPQAGTPPAPPAALGSSRYTTPAATTNWQPSAPPVAQNPNLAANPAPSFGTSGATSPLPTTAGQPGIPGGGGTAVPPAGIPSPVQPIPDIPTPPAAAVSPQAVPVPPASTGPNDVPEGRSAIYGQTRSDLASRHTHPASETAGSVSGKDWPSDNRVPATSTNLANTSSAGTSEPSKTIQRMTEAVAPSATAQLVTNPYYPSTQDASDEGQQTRTTDSSSSNGTSESGTAPSFAGTSSGSFPTPSPDPSSVSLPDGQAVRVTGQQRFQLEYDLESSHANGAQEIQLWGTRDGGVTWEKWGVDSDKTSPFDVQVDQDGVYGFRVVIIAANGLATDVPRSGSPADLWVIVDTKPPQAEITAVAYGTGSHVGELEIRWQAEDDYPESRPISLYFGPSPDGPWTTIAAGLPNTGQYYWVIDGSVPKKVFIRLEVTDRAGHSVERVTREPINLEALVPRARIRGLRELKVSK
ncbi:MAG: hypothetical protein KatS3mg110_1898 [Pirellulaceae bacterium]|nr:MAG: hypothetical protein KatS3mg110_1898 [Pirellulaceae bacterium]